MGIHVRITETDRVEDERNARALTARYVPEGGRFLVVRELGKSGDNPHYHIWLPLQETQKANVRAFAKTLKSSYGRGTLAVTKWGDTSSDFHYFLKGTKEGSFHVINASFNAFEQQAMHKAYWAVNAALVKHGKVPGETITETLVRLCKQKGVSDRVGIVRVLVESRAGREQICPMKHRGVVLSAYALLAGTEESECFIECMAQNIFRDM